MFRALSALTGSETLLIILTTEHSKLSAVTRLKIRISSLHNTLGTQEGLLFECLGPAWEELTYMYL